MLVLLRAGIVGLGKMGLLHMSMLSAMPNVTVVAACDKSKLITGFAKNALKEITFVNTVDDFATLNLDVVYVTTPIPSHAQIVESIFKENITSNIFVEKTLASSVDQAEIICKLAAGSGGKNMVGYERRYAVTFKKAYELLQNGTIGKPVSFKAYAYSSDFSTLDCEKAQKASLARGGLLRDLCSHAIDLSLHFFGDLKVVSKRENKLDNSGFVESLTINVEGEDVVGMVDASWCKAGYRLPEIGLELDGTKGAINVNDDQLTLKRPDEAPTKLYRLNLGDNVDFLLGAPEYYRESKAFIASIAEGSVAQPDFLAALKVERIIDEYQRIS
ncbi:MAG: Gfo/Idh/MocA family oxidoreductase [Candidatus Bathyarchaeota archaeon]|nr:Gfo/Idh/MocA family oxidoreductase [Candidatus Bathyarchaeota archaeon]